MAYADFSILLEILPFSLEEKKILKFLTISIRFDYLFFFFFLMMQTIMLMDRDIILLGFIDFYASQRIFTALFSHFLLCFFALFVLIKKAL